MSGHDNFPRFVLYDGRAKLGDYTIATVMDLANTEAEARSEGSTTWAGYDAIWFEYGEPRFDIPPAKP